MVDARKASSSLKRARVLHEVEAAAAAGEALSYSELARRAGVDRSMFYGPASASLRADIDAALARATEDQARGRSAGTKASLASLRSELANQKAIVKRQADQIAALEKRLSRLLGQQLVADLPPEAWVGLHDDEAAEEIALLRLELGELRITNETLQEELDAARRLNRELMARLNS